MEKIGRTLLLALLWACVAAYVAYAAARAYRARSAATVRKVRIEVQDSTAQGSLVTAREVQGWIARSGLRTVGLPLDSVDLTALERVVLANGFVDRAAAYIAGEGVLRIELSQRIPVVRLLVDGMNSYATREGTLFAAPPRSARYVPVVTGPYRPPVPADYSGSLRLHVDREQARIDSAVAGLERSKYPFYAAARQTERKQREARGMRVKRRWWKFEKEEDFDLRVKELRQIKADLARKYRYEARCIRAEIERIGDEQERLRGQQKKLEKSYEDFMKLLTFVDHVEEDDFWRSELVQLIARTTPSGALELSFVPRSGGFTIRFGRLEQVEYKLDKLLRFYERGLPAIGWETFDEIDVRYADQVVCR